MIELGFTLVLNPRNWVLPDFTVGEVESDGKALYGKGYTLWFFLFAVSFNYFDLTENE